LKRYLLRAPAVLLISGLAGSVVGMFRFPTWQVAVESAQVVAHLVKYPAGNPFYIYHVKLWTILHQICALFLLAGVSEAMLSRLLSGVLGMVSFQALSLVMYAICQDAWLAIGAAFVIVFSRIADHGVIYPVILISTDHTYGALGLSLFVLVGALFATGFSRSGAFLLGLAPAVHPSLGAWLWLTMGVTIAWHWIVEGREGTAARAMFPIRFFLAGCAVTALSLMVQLGVTTDVPHVDPAISARYVRAFVGFWDAHRRPVSFLHPGVIMNGVAVALAAVWMRLTRKDLPPSSLFILRTIIVAAAIGLLSIFASWIPVDRMPITALMLMPARLLNFNVMIYAALLFGLLNRYPARIWSHLLMILLAGGLLFCNTSMLWDSTMKMPALVSSHQTNPLHVVALVSIGLLAFGLFEHARAGGAGPGWAGGLRAAALAVIGLAVAATLAAPFPRRAFLDRTNDPFFAAVASEDRGLLLTSGTYHLVQLYTRRPVLLDGGGLDSLPYAPESGPAMDRILRDVYQVDLFHPPPELRNAGAISHGYNRPVWEHFSREKWLSIRRSYDVTQVLTRSDYHLDLPVAMENSSFRLYRIPD
jgi:hypothetical protein